MERGFDYSYCRKGKYRTTELEQINVYMHALVVFLSFFLKKKWGCETKEMSNLQLLRGTHLGTS
jgi:hypothetical protein